jgi:hypothetical protein
MFQGLPLFVAAQFDLAGFQNESTSAGAPKLRAMLETLVGHVFAPFRSSKGSHPLRFHMPPLASLWLRS